MATRQDFEDLLRKLDELEKRNLTSEQAAEVFELRGRINNVLKNYEFSRMLADIEIKFRDRIQKLEASVVKVTGSTKRKIQDLISDIKETIEFFKELRREAEYENSEWNEQKETSSIFDKAKDKMASVRDKIKDFISDFKTMREAAKEDQMSMEEKSMAPKAENKGLFDRLRDKKQEIKEMFEVARDMAQEDERAKQEQPMAPRAENKGFFDKLRQKTQEIKEMFEVARDMGQEAERVERETGKKRSGPGAKEYDYAQERALEAMYHYGM